MPDRIRQGEAAGFPSVEGLVDCLRPRHDLDWLTTVIRRDRLDSCREAELSRASLASYLFLAG